MLRLTGSERAVAEIAATAEHITSLTAAAAAFQLEPDVPGGLGSASASVALLDEASAPEAARTLAEIREWAQQALGFEQIPDIWRAFAHHHDFLMPSGRRTGSSWVQAS